MYKNMYRFIEILKEHTLKSQHKHEQYKDMIGN